MTSRRETISAVAGALLLLVGAFLVARAHGLKRDTQIAGAAVRVLEPTHLPSAGTAVVFHGLASDRVFMQQLGQWLAAQGFRVFLVDAPGHGGTPGSFTHAAALESSIRVLTELERSGQGSGGTRTDFPSLDPQTTVIVGHSMGGEIAIRLADYFPVAATIAFAPPPMVLPRRMPVNLLVIGAQIDLPQMKTSAAEILRAAGGARTSPEDFRQKRAASGINISWTAHGSVVLDSRAASAMAAWARAAVGLQGPIEHPPSYPLAGEFLGIVGICLLFPLTATWMVRIFRIHTPAGKALSSGALHSSIESFTAGADHSPVPVSVWRSLGRWGVSALLALNIVSFWYPQRLFPFYEGGYLACFLLVVGIALVLLFRKDLRGAFDRGYRPAFAASVLGLVLFISLGSWLDWQLTDVWMSGVRWHYFVPLFFANLPYAMAEEATLGPPEKSRRVWRFGTFVALRLALLLALLAGNLILLSGQVLMALLAAYFAGVSLGQRAGADALRRRTGSAAAAAIFSAILAAWFMAAVFPLS